PAAQPSEPAPTTEVIPVVGALCFALATSGGRWRLFRRQAFGFATKAASTWLDTHTQLLEQNRRPAREKIARWPLATPRAVPPDVGSALCAAVGKYSARQCWPIGSRMTNGRV